MKLKSPYDVMFKAPKNGSFQTMLPGMDSNHDTQDQNLMSYH
jgi:hypothetical protein